MRDLGPVVIVSALPHISEIMGMVAAGRSRRRGRAMRWLVMLACLLCTYASQEQDIAAATPEPEKPASGGGATEMPGTPSLDSKVLIEAAGKITRRASPPPPPRPPPRPPPLPPPPSPPPAAPLDRSAYADVSARDAKLLFNYQLSGAPFVYPDDLLGPPQNTYPNVTVYFLDWEATDKATVQALRAGGYRPICYFSGGEPSHEGPCSQWECNQLCLRSAALQQHRTCVGRPPSNTHDYRPMLHWHTWQGQYETVDLLPHFTPACLLLLSRQATTQQHLCSCGYALLVLWPPCCKPVLYVLAGAWESTRPDQANFTGLDLGAVITGWSTSTVTQKFINIRSTHARNAILWVRSCSTQLLFRPHRCGPAALKFDTYAAMQWRQVLELP
jgi:hypothetical protein